ncbi:DUF4132 domain-containing protein [bacterium]|nr:DUF4132 domain-containing protein [bacterium]
MSIDFFNLHWTDGDNSKYFNIDEALKSYLKALNYGTHPYLLIDIADIYYKNGDFEKAEEYFLKGESTLPGKDNEFSCNWVSLAKFFYEYKKDSQKALQIVDKYFVHDYDLLNLGLNILLENKNENKNRLVEYLFYFFKYNNFKFKDVSYLNKDNEYLFKEYESDIIEYGLKNLKDNLLSDFYKNIGYHYFEKNSYEKAIDFFKQGLSLDFDVYTCTKIADIYYKNLNNSKEAEKYYLDALKEIESDDDEYEFKNETILIAKFFIEQPKNKKNLERVLKVINKKITDEKYSDDMKDIKGRVLLKLEDKSSIEYLAKLQRVMVNNFSNDLFEKYKTEIENYVNDYWKNSKKTKEDVIKSIFKNYSDFNGYKISLFFDENSKHPTNLYFYYWNKLVRDYYQSFINFDDKYMIILMNKVLDNYGFNYVLDYISMNKNNITEIIKCLLKTKQPREKIFELIYDTMYGSYNYDDESGKYITLLSIFENLLKNDFTSDDLKELTLFIKNKNIFYSKRDFFMTILLKIDFEKYINDILESIDYKNIETIKYILKQDKNYLEEIKKIYLDLEYNTYYIEEVLNSIDDINYTKKVVLKVFEDFIEKNYTKSNKNELINYINSYLSTGDKTKFNDLVVENSNFINSSSNGVFRYLSEILTTNKDDNFFKRALTLSLYFDRDYTFSILLGLELSDEKYSYEKIQQFINKYDISMELLVEYVVLKSYTRKFDNVVFNNETELFYKIIKTLDATEQKNWVVKLWDFNKDKIYPLAYDLLSSSSKPVRAEIVLLLTRYEEKIEDYKKLLTAKKQQSRESGIKLITNLKFDGVEELLKELLEKESAEAVKKTIKECLLELSKNKIVKKTEIVDGKIVETIENNIFSNEVFSKEFIIKSSEKFKIKNSKEPVSGVSFLKVSTLPKLLWKDDKTFVGLNVVYYFINLFSTTKSSIPSIEGKQVKQFIDKDSFIEFAKEIYNRWNNDTKTKWIFGIVSLSGDNYFVPIFKKQIKDLVDNSRGAMASILVESMALLGTSLALQNVDFISRKIKHNQVKSVAIKSLEIAAKELNFSKDELLDKIIPDFGFDISGKLELDFGSRKFTLKLTPEDFIILDENGKNIKTLPKPNKNDNEEMANESINLFKEIKKEIKEQSKMQKERLENGISKNRLWSKENWSEIFISNPIMKVFGVTLIWGVYEKNILQSTFRYNEDGNLSDINDNSFSLPENCLIGIVHPIELKKDEIEKWKIVLSDYELIQPFKQLERDVYILEKDKEENYLLDDFNGFMVSRGGLKTKFKKFGWEPFDQDQGYFECYSKYIKDYDLTVNLHFEGDSLDSYEDQSEEIAIYTVEFLNNFNKLKLKEIPARLYSEIYNEIKTVSNSGSGFNENNKRK